jgi:hypothetical protein
MRNFILKNIRKLNELSRHPHAPTYVCWRSIAQGRRTRARQLEHAGAIGLVRYADFDDLDHLGEKSRASWRPLLIASPSLTCGPPLLRSI